MSKTLMAFDFLIATGIALALFPAFHQNGYLYLALVGGAATIIGFGRAKWLQK